MKKNILSEKIFCAKIFFMQIFYDTMLPGRIFCITVMLKGGLIKVKSDKPITMINSNNSLAKILDVLDLCIQAIDADGNTTYYSRGVEIMEGLQREDVLGKNITDIYQGEAEHSIDMKNSIMMKVLQNKRPALNQYMVYYVKGKRFNIVSDVYPIFDGNTFAGAIALFRDVAKAKAIAHDIIELEKNLLLNNNKPADDSLFGLDNIICGCKKMSELIEMAKKMAATNMPVMIEGKTGTGKELFAQGIHRRSAFSNGPFVAINCAAIPENLMESILFGTNKGAFTGALEKPGLLEEAENGTIFLDEINSMPIHLQSKLLRVLQTRRFMRLGSNKEISFNARIISAINVDPRDAVQNNQLRADIYYRLGTLSLSLPPLKERYECIPLLADHFIEKANDTLGKQINGLADDVRRVFYNYDWPGNIREMEHVIAYAIALSNYEHEEITFDILPPYLKKKYQMPFIPKSESTSLTEDNDSLQEYLQGCEARLILQKSEQLGGNITKMAAALGISRQNLQYRVRRLHLNLTEAREKEHQEV